MKIELYRTLFQVDEFPGEVLVFLRMCVGNVSLNGMVFSYPTIISGSRNPFEPFKSILCFGRMLDKIRLVAISR